MKQRLPLSDRSPKTGARREQERSRANALEFAGRPSERRALAQRVVAIAHVNQVAASSKLAAQLCAALAREGSAAVGALISVDNSALAPEAQAAFAAVVEAGARHAKLVRIPDGEQRAAAALESALDDLAGVQPCCDWIVAWGNALPHLFQPYFTVVVTGHRRELTHADPLVLQAQLEVTAPGDELATLLARKLVGDQLEP